MPQTNRQQRRAASAPQRGLQVIALPAELPDGDVQLRATASRLLRHAHVRSVSIDHSRREAIIRLHADKPLEWDAGDSFCLASTEQYAEPPTLVSWTDSATGHVCFIKRPAQVSGWRKLLLKIAAAVSLLLALLGVALPGLPTTPFVLLASYCLVRTSPALHERLLHSRLFGGLLRDWHLHRGIRPHIRVKAMALIAVVVAVSLLLTNWSLASTLAVAAIAFFGLWYVWRLPSIKD